MFFACRRQKNESLKYKFPFVPAFEASGECCAAERASDQIDFA
jgi:hypothetical protein